MCRVISKFMRRNLCLFFTLCRFLYDMYSSIFLTQPLCTCFYGWISIQFKTFIHLFWYEWFCSHKTFVVYDCISMILIFAIRFTQFYLRFFHVWFKQFYLRSFNLIHSKRSFSWCSRRVHQCFAALEVNCRFLILLFIAAFSLGFFIWSRSQPLMIVMKLNNIWHKMKLKIKSLKFVWSCFSYYFKRILYFISSELLLFSVWFCV